MKEYAPPYSRLSQPNAALCLYNDRTSTLGGGHLRKHGIRLNSALVLEKRRITTAADQRVRPGDPERKQTSKFIHQRIKAQSAPLGKIRTREPEVSMYDEMNNTPPQPVVSSLAAYSPQSQRFNVQRLTERERIKMRIRQSEIKSHRVDKRFFLSGRNYNVLDRYQVDQEQNRLLTEFMEKKREESKTLKLSRKQIRFQSEITGEDM